MKYLKFLTRSIKAGALVLLTSLAIGGTPAYASLDSAFGELLGNSSSYGAEAVRSAHRTTFVAGGGDIRFGRARLTNIVSITPPHLSAGCNGISAHFGGFSWINGEQIKQMIERLGQNAAGVAISLVIKVLCPMCEAVIQQMMKLAQEAAKWSVDSCQLAKRLANEVYSNDQAKQDQSQYRNFCTEKGTEANSDSDWLSSLSDSCNTLSKSMAGVTSWVNGTGENLTAEQKKQREIEAAKQKLYGNYTWQLLTAMGMGHSAGTELVHKTLLMNLLGTTIVDSSGQATKVELDPNSSPAPSNGAASAPSGGAAETAPHKTVMSSMSAPDAFNLYLCGMPSTSNTLNGYSSAISFCKSFWATWYQSVGGAPGLGTNSNPVKMMMVCDANDLDKCLNTKWVAAGSWLSDQGLGGKGFVFLVTDLLRHGVTKIRNDQPFFSGSTDSEDGKLFALLDAAPYPLYQALNAAAVYPAAASQLIDTAAVLVAELAAVAYFDDILNKARTTGGETSLPQDAVDRLAQAMEQVREVADRRRAVIATNMTLQQSLSASIRQINQAIQKQVMTEELLGSQTFSSQLMSAIGGGGGGGSASAGSGAGAQSN